nr:hypothetical protein SFHH103_04279 [Sinorhizobium fredii HH103]
MFDALASSRHQFISGFSLPCHRTRRGRWRHSAKCHFASSTFDLYCTATMVGLPDPPLWSQVPFKRERALAAHDRRSPSHEKFNPQRGPKRRP